MKKQPSSRMCYACGIENPVGLHLQFYEDDDGRVTARFTPADVYQGQPGVLHGGVICTLLDETIGRALLRDDYWAVTGRLEVRFREPVPTGAPIEIIGEVTRVTSHGARGHGEIRLADGRIAAEADALFVRLSDAQTREMREKLDFWEVVEDEAEMPCSEGGRAEPSGGE